MTEDVYTSIVDSFVTDFHPPDDAKAAFQSLFRFKTYQKGELLVRQGQAHSPLFFLTAGLVKFVYLLTDGKQVTKHIAQAPSFTGCTRSMLSNEPAYFSIVCLEDVEAYLCRYSDVEALYQRFPIWERFGRKWYEKMFLDKERREMEFLLYNGAQRYEQFLRTHADYADRIPLQDVATLIGVSAVQLSRIRAKQKPQRPA